MMNKQELELYIHIPFCVKKCNYCDFLSFATPEKEYEAYVEQLIQEIHGQSSSFEDFIVTSVFFGGGTPSILSAELMGDILLTLQMCFTIANDAEITIEANPGTLTVAKLETYLMGGVNRLSIGLQSTVEAELKALGRIHNYDSFLKSYQRARQAGFTNINIDLMSGLPGQSLESWKGTLRKVLMLRPEHISAYSLIIEEGTPFYEKYGEDATGLPEEELDRDMYHLTKEMLAEHGYRRYEISNYAKPGYECNHNNGYWTGVPYLGLGLGASSYTHGHRYQNISDLQEYLSRDLGVPGAAVEDIHKLTLEEQMEEFMFLGLRQIKGVSGAKFLERFQVNMFDIFREQIEHLEANGLIEVRKPEIRLTELGIDVSNVVLSEFLLD